MNMRYIVFILLFICTQSVFALDVSGLEKLNKEAESSSNEVSALMNKGMLKSYFQGMTDLLNNSIDGAGKINYLDSKSKICLPKGILLNGDVVKAMTLSEIKTAKEIGIFGKDMLEYNVAVFVYSALTRNYPCATL